MLFVLRPAGATDLELITRANPISDTPHSATNFGAAFFLPAFSDDERYVAFPSIAPNASPGQIDTPPHGQDVFVWDRSSGVATLVSHAAGSPAQTGNGTSVGQSVSADGRFVTFRSRADDLVAGQIDNSDTTDIFQWDRTTGLIRLINRAFNSAVTASDAPVTRFAASVDGRFVVFISAASNLLPGHAGPVAAIYLWDRDTGSITLVSHRAGLPAEPAAGDFSSVAMSGDGGVVAYDSSAADLVAGQVDGGFGYDVFLWTRATGASVLASRVAGTVATASDNSSAPSLSRDGRFVVYLSFSEALIPGGDGNKTTDAYLFDRVTGTNTLVSHASGQGNVGSDGFCALAKISADGSAVLHWTTSSNLVAGQVDTNGERDLFLWRRALDQTILVSHRPSGGNVATLHGATPGSVSSDGRFVAFLSGDPDLAPGQNDPPSSTQDAFVFDRDSGVVSLMSHRSGAVTVAANDETVEPIISPGGNFASFTSLATDVVAGVEDWNVASDLFLYDRATTVNRLITGHAPGEASSTASIYFDAYPSRAEISADGRWIAFDSLAENLAGGIRSGFLGNVFLADRTTGAQIVVSRSAAPLVSFGEGVSFVSSISSDGRFVTYVSDAPDLVAGQVDSQFPSTDVFLFDRDANSSTLVSHRAGQPNVSDVLNHVANAARSTPDGRFVAFAFFLTLTDGADASGFYLFDRTTGANTLVTHQPGQPEVPASGRSDDLPSLSADGRYVAYSSLANELVTGVTDDNNSPDIFLFDRTTGENRLITPSALFPGEAAGDSSEPEISADGRYVAFVGSSLELLPGQVTGDFNVFLWDRTSGALRMVSHNPAGASGNDRSAHPSISADGRWVAFSSEATDLVANQVDTPDTPDAFLFDRDTDTVVLASHAPGRPATAIGTLDFPGVPALSADGGKLAFATLDGVAVAGQIGLGGLFVYDRATATNLLASHRPGDATRPGNAPGFFVSFNADGSAACFASTANDLVARDYNDATDVFVHATSTAVPTGAYFTVPPCRLLDTRAPGQSPALASAAIRALTVAGRCGIPASAKSIAVTLTVTGGTGLGFLSLFPANLPVPGTAALNFSAAQTRSSNAIASLATNGAGTLGLTAFVTGNGTVEAIVDVFGYFE